MLKNRRIFLILFLFGLANLAFLYLETDPIQLKYPESFGEPTYDFSKNPLTKQGVELGRKLFYDPILSKDSTTSCSSCHLSYTAFTHVDHALSHGIGDSIGNRNSPSLMNLAWSKSFMWDGAAHHLDVQALAPIHDQKELGEDLKNVIAKLQRHQEYPSLFSEAFGENLITGEHFLKALSQFQLTLISANSKYDKVQRNETTFSEKEKKGYTIFKKHCNNCHAEPLFTTGDFANNGLPVDTILNDWGRMIISQQSVDSLKFKIPTLRNLQYSFPYMHDGRFKKLNQVLEHYTLGIIESPTLAPELNNGITLSADEKVELTAFLLTLTDKEFVFNPDFAFPRKR